MIRSGYVTFGMVLFALTLGATLPAHAQTFTVEVSPGAAGYEAVDSFGLGVAGTVYLPLPGDTVALGFRPEFAWHKLDIGNDYFFTGNVQLDVRVSDSVVPSLWVGGGMNKFSGSGPDLATFLATSPSEGQLAAFLASGRGGGSGTGGVLNVGGQVRISVLEFLYVAPEFTYIRGMGDVEGNNYRVGLALGAGF